MTTEAAIHSLFNSFGVSAYKATAVPDDVVFPYIVYEGITGCFTPDMTPTAVSVQLFYYAESEKTLNDKVHTISQAICDGSCIGCDDGVLWVYRGTPWCTSINDQTDKTIKGRNLIFNFRFLTR